MTTTEPAALCRLRFAWTAAVVAGAISPAVGQVQVQAARLEPFLLNTPATARAIGQNEFGGAITLGSGEQHPTIWRNGVAELLGVPAGYHGSVLAMDEGYAAGYTAGPQTSAAIATIWAGPNRLPINLNPPGQHRAVIQGARGGEQVGFTGTSSIGIAFAGRGTPDSFIAVRAIPEEMIEAKQGAGQSNRAALWHGTAQSFVDLHPQDADSSAAFSTDGSTQVGVIIENRRSIATIWRGSASDRTDLSPTTNANSVAIDIDESTQVGYAQIPSQNGSHPFPVAWNGTAESMITLLPDLPSNASGAAVAIDEGVIVGNVGSQAGLWLRPDAGSFINLHHFLPNNYEYSFATDVEVNGNLILISGYARYAGIFDPFIWRVTIPEPSAASIVLVFGTPLIIRTRRR